MKLANFPSLLLLWTLRDLLRHPGKTLLNLTALLLLTFLAATALLTNQALEETTQHLLSRSPAMVVRRIDAGGWRPIPIEPALRALQTVPGVIHPRARIWGAVATPQGPATIVAMDDKIQTYLNEQNLPLPKSGQAVVGRGLVPNAAASLPTLRLTSGASLQLEVIATLPAATEMVSFDLVITTPADARHLLSIPANMASDMVLDLFHQQEAEAIFAELAQAFPWPVRITSREETGTHFSTRLARSGSIIVVLLTPAIVAMLLLVMASGHDLLSRRTEAGLLRTLGWTTQDLARMQLLRATLTGVPAVVLGQLAAYGVLFTPVNRWVGRFLLGWPPEAPAYYLSSSGAGLVLAELFVIIAVPYILASLWPVLPLAAKDPLTLLKGGLQR